MENTAKPVQARSQRTREKLLRAALAMYAKKGYHNTTVDEIAGEAEVSTGIAYRYFRNKKDMLLSAIAYSTDNIIGIAHIDNIPVPEDAADIRAYITAVLVRFEELHRVHRSIHEELEGLRHTDEDVRSLYNEITRDKMAAVTERLGQMTGDGNIRERAYLAVGIMEQHCHMLLDNDMHGLDADVLRDMTASAVISVLDNGR
ncbi:MAG: TetR/AcrR family transcriptional regulator [Oscillospiraceae bacterium]|nr:TetR/AcrR family transcriptional regulator [Oscillospiraceae bacterium]